MKHLRIELHCHTHASHDGMITPAGLAKAALRRGLDAIAITDHDTIAGALEFRDWMRGHNVPLEIVIGEERTLEDGCHLIGLFLQEPLKSATARDAVDEIHAQGGLALVPHPFRKDGLCGPSATAAADADAFEIHNAKCSHALNEQVRTAFAGGAKGVFGGSDAHYEADVGECVNVIEWQGSIEQTLRAMFAHEAPFSILATPQRPGRGERSYAGWYHRLKKICRMPRPLLPAAKQLYRFYWNHLRLAPGGGLQVLHEEHPAPARLSHA